METWQKALIATVGLLLLIIVPPTLGILTLVNMLFLVIAIWSVISVFYIFYVLFSDH